MKNKQHLTSIALPVVAACALLTGCASKSTSLYQWDGYQPQVYAFLTNKSAVDEQITALEEARQIILAKGKAFPPGFHAHLGALYANVGRFDAARDELTAEKAAFPESSAYMDFMLTKLK